MGKRPRRKVVLILVEGKSDRETFRVVLPELLEKRDEEIEVFFVLIANEGEERGGDITTSRYKNQRGKEYWVTPKNIEEAIYELFLRNFFDKEKIMPKDITEVIHIVDIDGVYIPDDAVYVDKKINEENSPFYDSDKIRCIDVESILRRNENKRNNLDYLSQCSTIKIRQKTVKYSIYFFSSNLEDFMYNNANIDHREKVYKARDTQYEYIGKPDKLVDMIRSKKGALVGLSYDESWSFIKKGKNSLKPHTNINLLFERLQNN